MPSALQTMQPGILSSIITKSLSANSISNKFSSFKWKTNVFLLLSNLEILLSFLNFNN